MADKFGKKLRMMNEPDIKVLICGEIINLEGIRRARVIDMDCLSIPEVDQI